MSFAGGSEGKESSYNEGGLDSIPWSGGSPEGNIYPLQYSCLENPMYKGAWQSSPWGHKELDMTERLTHIHKYTHKHKNIEHKNLEIKNIIKIKESSSILE